MCLQLVSWLLQEESFQGSGRLPWLVYQPAVSLCINHKMTCEATASITDQVLLIAHYDIKLVLRWLVI